jgi:hypothetical protein
MLTPGVMGHALAPVDVVIGLLAASVTYGRRAQRPLPRPTSAVRLQTAH